MIGAIELGGTKIVCGVGVDAKNIVDVIRFPTSHPNQCLSDIHSFFTNSQLKHGKLTSIGVASFGPIDIHPMSEKLWDIFKNTEARLV